MAALMFDKSAFQALNAAQHGQLIFRFQEMVAPILLLEMMGDLSKPPEDPGRAMHFVRRLAEKFHGSGGTINTEWKLACAGSLTGNFEPPMTGQILVDDFKEGVGPDGERAIVLEPTDGNRNILRWAQAQFHADEHEAAEHFRKRAHAFEISELMGRYLNTTNVPIVNALEKIPGAVDGVLSDPAMQKTLIEWLIDQLRFAGRVLRITGPVAQIRTETRVCWEAAKRPLLRDFAPYAHHCARALLMLIVGNKVLSRRPTNRLDVEYLLYLPFCHLFVTNDPLHEQLGPMLLRPDQRILRSDVLMHDPQRVAKEADARIH
jgi:hypothetical protein